MALVSVVGTRPNLVKMARYRRARASVSPVPARARQTGQHYDRAIRRTSFARCVPAPTHDRVGSGSTRSRCALMERLERSSSRSGRRRIVPGDVNRRWPPRRRAKLGIRSPSLVGPAELDRTMPRSQPRLTTRSRRPMPPSEEAIRHPQAARAFPGRQEHFAATDDRTRSRSAALPCRLAAEGWGVATGGGILLVTSPPGARGRPRCRRGDGPARGSPRAAGRVRSTRARGSG